MTTIACNRQCMAADSRLTAGSTISTAVKLFRHQGAIIGVAGMFAECLEFVAWIKRGKTGRSPRMSEVEALVLRPGGSILSYDHALTPIPILEPFTAIGTGHQGALVAMHLGADPASAVRVVRKVDSCTGGRVRVLRLR